MTFTLNLSVSFFFFFLKKKTLERDFSQIYSSSKWCNPLPAKNNTIFYKKAIKNFGSFCPIFDPYLFKLWSLLSWMIENSDSFNSKPFLAKYTLREKCPYSELF